MLDTVFLTDADLRALLEHEDPLIHGLAKRLHEAEKRLAASRVEHAYTLRSELRRARVRANMYRKLTSRKPMTEESSKNMRRSIIAHLRLRRESERNPA